MEIVKFAVSICFSGKNGVESIVQSRLKHGGKPADSGKCRTEKRRKKHQTNQNPAGYTQFHRVRENVDKSIVKIPMRVL